MKKAIIFLITIVVIIAGVIFAKKILNKKYDYKIEEISEFKYYIYKDSNKYGVIDETGKIIIEANYEKIIIPNPSKAIFICYNENKTEVFNQNKEKLFSKYESVEPIKLKNVAGTLNYEKSVLKYKQDGKYGLIDFNGKEITKNIYEKIDNLPPTEGKFLVSKDEKYGVIDLKGNKLVDVKYDVCKSDEYYNDENGYTKSGFVVSIKTDDGYKCGYISYTGKKILDIKYNDIGRVLLKDDKKIYLIVSANGKYGLYKKAKKIIENDYQEIIYNENFNLLMLQKNKKYGIASLDGTILIDATCDEIDLRGIYLYVSNAGTNKVYDSNVNVVDMNFNASIYETENEDYRISTILNNNITYYGIEDKNGNKLVEDKYRYIEYLYKNYFIAKDDNGNLGVINSNGKIIVDMRYSSLQRVKGKNIVQAIDSNGISEIYSDKMENVLSIENANISIQNDYVIISNGENKTYLDNDGNIIKDISNLKKESYPDQIGNLKKEQFSIEDVYYINK